MGKGMRLEECAVFFTTLTVGIFWQYFSHTFVHFECLLKWYVCKKSRARVEALLVNDFFPINAHTHSNSCGTAMPQWHVELIPLCAISILGTLIVGGACCICIA